MSESPAGESPAGESPAGESIVARYLALGLTLGRHVDGLVDAYYGPSELAARVAAGTARPPGQLVEEARALLGAIDDGEPLDHRQAGLAGVPEGQGRFVAVDEMRRRWIRAQVAGLLTTARVIAGERLGYSQEVESSYGVCPSRVPVEVFAEAHRRLDEVLPGRGPVADRMVAWREAHVTPVEAVEPAVASLATELRERTLRLFGLPDGENVTFELVRDKPWAGFNYYLGDLRSRVALNVDLPVPSTSLAHLVAHEAYPGHHTEHSLKEVGLVRRQAFWEESIFLVGTPQCLLAEGLADVGLEVAMGHRPERLVAEHLAPLRIPYDPVVVASVAEVTEALDGVRANAAFRLHEDGADPETVITEVARWGLLPRERAEKTVAFLMSETWRAYVTCYVEGRSLCRRFVAGDPDRFKRLLTEQLTPEDLMSTLGPAGAPEDPAASGS